jgi:hypothetical protein
LLEGLVQGKETIVSIAKNDYAYWAKGLFDHYFLPERLGLPVGAAAQLIADPGDEIGCPCGWGV